jgi:kumamolisin
MTTRHHLHILPRSFRLAPEGGRVGAVPDETPMRLTVVLRPATPVQPAGPRLTRAEYAHHHGTRQSVIDDMVAYAQGFGLAIDHADAATHVVRLSGTYAQAASAFEPEGMGLYRTAGGGTAICRSGHVRVPAQMAEHVVAVTGFDRRPVARPHFRIRPRQSTSQTVYAPAMVAERYGFPGGLTGANETIALIELGGGYDAAQMSQYFASHDVHRIGTLEAVAVDGASTAPSGDPNGPDAEVQLDIQIAGSIAPAANLAVYIGGNDSDAFLNTVAAAIHDTVRAPSVVSISWGDPETRFAAQDIDAMDQLFQTAASLGITICAASGDSGATDGSADEALTTDFPASSPHVLGCGGTRLPKSGAETAWNDGAQGGASGGGYSAHFPRPDWQAGNQESGRGVPDVAGDADPETGYAVAVDGTDTVVGGTSAVAPLWAALIALANQSLKGHVGFVNALLYQNPDALTDITSGNNNGYRCAAGWDPVTGLGTPKGDAVLAVLKGGHFVA